MKNVCDDLHLIIKNSIFAYEKSYFFIKNGYIDT